VKALVTGSTGLLGANLAHLLVEQGHEVEALARSREKAERQLGHLPVEIVEGDMADVSAFAGRLAGCDWVFHTAAFFREYYSPGDHWKTLERLNVTATIELLEAAERAGVSKAVHTSSSGVIGPNPSGPGDETCVPGDVAESNLYFKSKVVAEQAIASFLERSQLDVSLALPGWMFGPRDAAPTHSGRMVIDFCRQKLPGIVPGGANVADARDVADGMIRAAEHGRSGERYILAGDYASFDDVFSALEQVTGVPAPRRHLPKWLLYAVAVASETGSRVTGREPLISRQAVRTMREERVTADKSRQELGASFRPLVETLTDEVDWFRANGYLEQALQPLPAAAPSG
jgi:nucleoside-diphosphate-sugar epimerase